MLCLTVFLGLIAGFSNVAFAQTATVKGRVVDESGAPLMGAGVVVKGTTKGAVADLDGNYSIQAPSNATLVFSYIGFTSQEIAIDGKGVVNCTLVQDANLLQVVVFVGYGYQFSKTLTSSIF